MSPARAAGAADRPCDVGDAAKLAEVTEPKPGKRGPCGKRAQVEVIR